MTSNAEGVTRTVQSFATTPPTRVPAEPPAKADPAINQRLVIEEGPNQGTFIYKTVDRTTGEVIRQFPREEVIKLISSDAYQAGTVTSTRA